jgi:hypothetical protein
MFNFTCLRPYVYIAALQEFCQRSKSEGFKSFLYVLYKAHPIAAVLLYLWWKIDTDFFLTIIVILERETQILFKAILYIYAGFNSDAVIYIADQRHFKILE